MISSFRVQGFKCFRDLSVKLTPIVALSGGNGVGKSSLIQALLLAHLAQDGDSHVALNGPVGLRLGQVLDVVRAPKVQFSAASHTGEEASWVLAADSDEALVLRVEERPTPTFAELDRRLMYLQAERLGPRDVLEIDSRPDDELHVGVRGEFVAHVLDRRERSHKVHVALRHPTAQVGPTLGKQTEAWMQDLVPGIEVLVQAFPMLSATAIRLRKAGLTTEWLRAQNMGFGVSYVLPIIVAGLVAAPGSTLIVENPEAHLHPAGQSLVAQFLGRVATTGVQVILETHSDHVLNGLRLASIDNNPLQPENVRILHFISGDEQPSVQSIGLTERGALTAAPAGFFDQSEKDLAAILEARRRV
jgi:predicted ATPase